MAAARAQVLISDEVYQVCIAHALMTEHEEVMGLLLGDAVGEDIHIWASLTLRRIDKRKDRVEISPESLVEASETAERITKAVGCKTRVVGWYHSHPHITCLPSHVDLQTQLEYQGMDGLFIGLIFAVFNADPRAGRMLHELMAFRADGSGGGAPRRVELQPRVVPLSSLLTEEQETLANGIAEKSLSRCFGHRAMSAAAEHGFAEMQERHVQELTSPPGGDLDGLTSVALTARHMQHMYALLSDEVVPLRQYVDDAVHNSEVLADLYRNHNAWVRKQPPGALAIPEAPPPADATAAEPGGPPAAPHAVGAPAPPPQGGQMPPLQGAPPLAAQESSHRTVLVRDDAAGGDFAADGEAAAPVASGGVGGPARFVTLPCECGLPGGLGGGGADGRSAGDCRPVAAAAAAVEVEPRPSAMPEDVGLRSVDGALDEEDTLEEKSEDEDAVDEADPDFNPDEDVRPSTSRASSSSAPAGRPNAASGRNARTKQCPHKTSKGLRCQQLIGENEDGCRFHATKRSRMVEGGAAVKRARPSQTHSEALQRSTASPHAPAADAGAGGGVAQVQTMQGFGTLQQDEMRNAWVATPCPDADRAEGAHPDSVNGQAPKRDFFGGEASFKAQQYLVGMRYVDLARA